MTSADVVYTFDRLKTSGIPYAQNRFPTLTSVTAQGPRAVRFTLSKADPGFLLNMGDPFTVACAILSRKAGESKDLTTQMVGTGPFAMVSYAPTRQLKVKRFDKYWGNEGQCRQHPDRLHARGVCSARRAAGGQGGSDLPRSLDRSPPERSEQDDQDRQRHRRDDAPRRVQCGEGPVQQRQRPSRGRAGDRQAGGDPRGLPGVR